MDTSKWIELILSVLAGISACIPLVVKLVEYVEKAAKEKNWGRLLAMVVELMETAEEMFDAGADRKRWVLAMVKSSADSIDFDIDLSVVSKMIDDLCDMSKVVNPPISSDDGAKGVSG